MLLLVNIGTGWNVHLSASLRLDLPIIVLYLLNLLLLYEIPSKGLTLINVLRQKSSVAERGLVWCGAVAIRIWNSPCLIFD